MNVSTKTLTSLMVAQMLVSLISRRSTSARLFAKAFSTQTLSHTSSTRNYYSYHNRPYRHHALTSSTLTTAEPLYPSVASAATVTGRRSFQTTAVAVKAAVEEDLDAALENILGDAFQGAEAAPAPKKEKANGKSSSAASSTQTDFSDPAFLSTSNPRWVQAGLDPAVIDVLSGKGITQFTPVQGEAFDPIVAGRDVIGRSRTGTGKTLAFGLPSITRMLQLMDAKGLRDERGRLARGRKVSMVVLCPTRELARQVQDELKEVARPLGLFTEVFHGGVSYEPQARALTQGLDILVGTPGRVIDHMERGNLDLSGCETVVLDEADEMLNMGFAEDVEVILKGIGSDNQQKTQCLLFSATTPPWVKEIGKQYQSNVVAIDSTSEEGGARVAKTVRHCAVQVPPGVESKRAALEDIIAVEISKDVDIDAGDAVNGDSLAHNPIAAAAAQRKAKTNQAMQQKIFGKTIVFTETKREADELVSGGVFKSLTAQALHGDVGQKQRDATLNAFRAGAFNVLVATDVAARGIDIKDVDLVIQFDPPRDVDTYVHRSGRTGRAGKKGVSVLLFNSAQARDIVRIERDLGHGFRFDLVGPPSTEAALKAAAKTSAIACTGVPDETATHFRDAANALLAKTSDPADVIARCLAAISRRSADVQSRSLLTGELGMATVEMTNANGRPIRANDVMFTVGKLARMSKSDESTGFDSDVGKIQNHGDNGAVFDMDVEDAKKLVEFSKDIDAGGNTFRILHELEINRDADFGRSLDRRGGGGRFNERGDGRNFSRGNTQRFDRHGGDDRRGGYKGGDNRRGGSFSNRGRSPDHERGGAHGRSFSGRYDGRRPDRNDGW